MSQILPPYADGKGDWTALPTNQVMFYERQIERLTADNARLRDALAKIATDTPLMGASTHVRAIAREALEGK